MKSPILAALLLAIIWSYPASASSGGGTLTLVSDASNNKLQVTLAIPSVAASNTQTTTVTGTMNVSTDVDSATGATSALTLTGGNIAMSNMHFVLYAYIFFKAADISTASMAGTVYTPQPVPAPVTPNANGGTFDAALHHLIINSGTIGGTAGYPSAAPVNVNFADSPIDGAGAGTGTLTVVPGTSTATYRNGQATLVLPVDFTNTQDLNGTAVTVRVKGNIKAIGNVLIPLPDANGNGILDTWEITHFGNANPGSNAANADADGDGLSNLMEYALGTNPLLANPTPVTSDLEVVGASRYLRLTVVKNPAATNLTYTVETSADLRPSAWSTAQTLIEPDSPPGTLRVRDTVPISSAPHRYIRLKVTTP